jgi:uncharacterized protein
MAIIFFDTLILLLLGSCGWLLFKYLRLPVPDLLGSMTAIVLFRIFYAPLPLAPDFLSPLIQICLGLYIGSKVTRERVGGMCTLIKPALIIVSWVMMMAFVLGALLAQISNLGISPITGILSSTMGGLPEMTIIAMETEADVAVVVVMKTARMVLTVALFPIIFEKWLTGSNVTQTMPEKRVSSDYFFGDIIRSINNACQKIQKSFAQIRSGSSEVNTAYNIMYGFLTFAIAALGGLIFRHMNVPAGAMVGGMFFVVIASLSGLKVKTIPLSILLLLRVGLGIVIADNISLETFSVFTSGAFISAIVLSNLFIFLTFILVMYLLRIVTGWDYQTCFLAASPAGFTVMTILAIKYDKDVFVISMLHLCRLIAIKAVFPFLLMKIM